MIGITVQDLRAFVLVGRLLSFTEAAAKLGVTQPALSMAIRQLEDKLAASLFDRSTRTVQLSRVGAAILPSAERLVESFDRTVGAMGEVAAGKYGRIAIACPEGVAAHIVAPTIKDFIETNPGLMISVFDGDAASVEHMMHSLSADFGVTGYWQPHPDFVFEPLTTDECCVVCPLNHPFAERTTIPLTELDGVPIVALNRDTGVRRLIEAQTAALGIKLGVQFEVARVSTLIEMVASGLCVSVLTRLSTPYNAKQSIVVVPLEGQGLRYTVGIVTRAGKTLTPGAAQFLEALRHRFGSH